MRTVTPLQTRRNGPVGDFPDEEGGSAGALPENAPGGIFRKTHTNHKKQNTMQTQVQLKDRWNAMKAVTEALKERKISFLDSAEFKVSQMHTTICQIRRRIQDKGLPYVMKDEWFTFESPNGAKRAKRYWLEEVQQQPDLFSATEDGKVL